jgi:hypothetical protein
MKKAAKKAKDDGSTVSDERNISDYDYVDAQRLEDIQKKFMDSSWDDRLTMYNKIFEI